MTPLRQRKRKRSPLLTPNKRVAPAENQPDWLALPRDCVNWILLHVIDMRDLDAMRRCSHTWAATVTHFARIVRPRLRRLVSPPVEWGFSGGRLAVLPNGRIDGAVWLEKQKVSRFGTAELVRIEAPFFNGLFHGAVRKSKTPQGRTYARLDQCVFVAGRPVDGRWGHMTFQKSFLIQTIFHADYVTSSNGWERGRSTSVYFDRIDDSRVSVERLDDGVVDPGDNAVFDSSWGHARESYVVARRRIHQRTVTTGPIVGLDTVYEVLFAVFMTQKL